MSTVVLYAILWAAIIIAIAAAFSINAEKTKVFAWKDDIAGHLVKQFNVDYLEAFKMAQGAYSDWALMYKTELMESTEIIAHRLFYRRADNNQWMPHHFIGRQLPEALYRHPSWGGLIVEG